MKVAVALLLVIFATAALAFSDPKEQKPALGGEWGLLLRAAWWCGLVVYILIFIRYKKNRLAEGRAAAHWGQAQG